MRQRWTAGIWRGIDRDCTLRLGLGGEAFLKDLCGVRVCIVLGVRRGWGFVLRIPRLPGRSDDLLDLSFALIYACASPGSGRSSRLTGRSERGCAGEPAAGLDSPTGGERS